MATTSVASFDTLPKRVTAVGIGTCHPDERGAAGVVQMNGWTESRQESAEELKETYLLWRKRVGA